MCLIKLSIINPGGIVMFKKDSKKIIGVKQSIKALKNLESLSYVQVYVARDAAEKVIKPLLELAQNNTLDVIYIPTMQELGEICNIDVGAAAALILENNIIDL
ncbi:ribosomal L7Ae/L30e/S12e/Gadd45 family protein [Hathewaya histolytica]|uniref:Ribosomal protein HS6-type (S12/L30/L7a) n=2 Tax=Hathewaya histolytica TaxID=1498 RepID=A0A4U9RTH6_HATHI|nr:ribosomal protein HS6-type (S12/L30/L7a) [Hathewaya histolytica]